MEDFSGLPMAKRYIGAKSDISNAISKISVGYGLPTVLIVAIVGDVLGELREAMLLESVAPDLIEAKGAAKGAAKADAPADPGPEAD